MEDIVRESAGQLLCLKRNHMEPIITLTIDDQIPLSERVHCKKCFEESKNVLKLIPLKPVFDLLEEKFGQNNTQCQEYRLRSQNMLLNFLHEINKLQTEIMEIMKKATLITQQWLEEIRLTENKNTLMSKIKGLQLLNDNNLSLRGEEFIQNINNQFRKKLQSLALQFKVFDQYQKSFQLIEENKLRVQDEGQEKSQNSHLQIGISFAQSSENNFNKPPNKMVEIINNSNGIENKMTEK